jgi:hypothetical protein
MAGGSGEEENYWPGYVDALTTMTMVLTFIMMVLGVVIFSLSQNISKGIIASIAKAAKLEKQLTPSGSVDQLREQLVAALEDMQHTESAKAPEADPKDGERAAEAPNAQPSEMAESANAGAPDLSQETASQANKALSARIETALAPDKSETAGSAKIVPPPPDTQQAAPADKLLSAKIEAMPVKDKLAAAPTKTSSAPINEQAALSDKPQSEAEKKLEIADLDHKNRSDTPTKTAISGALLTLIFPNKSFAVDQPTSGEIKEFVQRSNVVDTKGKFIVRALAYVGGGSLTEARRIAYFRAMTVRKELIASGVASEKISLHVDETQDPKKENVQIMADH